MISDYTRSCITEELTNQNTTIMGAVLSKYPEAEADIAKIFSKGADPTDYAKGREVREKYGLDQLAQETTISMVFSLVNNFLKIFILIIIFLALIFFFIHFRFFKKIYDFAQDASADIDKFMKGEYDVNFDAFSEGAISGFASQLKLLAIRTRSSLESLNHDKENLKDYLTDISHQLKTPLASLRIFLDLMEENTEDIKTGKNNSIENEIEYVAKSNLLLDRMEWLINGLLDMSRIECSIVEMNMEPANLADTLDTVLQELWFKLKAKSLGVELHMEKQQMYVPHDRSWMGQAFENIIKNCIEYSPAGGVIEIDVDETESLVRVKIRDSGPGIPEEDIANIFDRFFTGKSAKRSGNGIGLALAKLIVQKHYGVISAENAENRGAVFIISIPKLE